MRKMGSLLIILRRVTGAEKLFEILKLDHFENIISATKTVTGYDQEKRTLKAKTASFKFTLYIWAPHRKKFVI